MTLQMLVLRYASFAGVPKIANIANRHVVLRFGETGGRFAAALGGPGIVDLAIIYLLDRRRIFYGVETDVKHYSREFSLYLVLALITTAIFWRTETAFWLIWQTNFTAKLGAVLGLLVGCVVKYDLDRRFVFTDRHLATST